ncbi:MAG: AAA family ATPase, partial [Muribaculaceae bacterium]|nr:AAA family ATPase [Muribaculaceae bacterium]
MKFNDIPGHEEVKSRLRHMVDVGRIPHALLLQGPSGIGKMAIARAFAQYVHCTDRRDGEPCGVCASCRQHQSFNHIDTHFVFPIVKRKSGSPAICDDFLPEWREYLTASPWMDYEKWIAALDKANAQPVIYVDESVSLLRKLQYTARTAAFKIVIIWLPEKMNAECANKLLKMVEEPFEDTLLVFVSNRPQEILPTIYSRLQRV